MEYVGAFTPQANPTGSFNLQYNHGHFLFINESYANLLIKGDAWQFPLQSGQCRMVCINQSSTSITYTTLSTLQIANAVDAVLVEYYAPGEKYLETYPSSLARQAIIGNTVQTSGGSVAQVINDGNAVGTQFIESTPTGDASSAVSIKNDATVVLGNATHHGSVTFTGTILYANQSGVLHQILQANTSGKPLFIGNGTDNVEVLLNLDVDNNLYVANVTTLDNGAIATDGAGKMTFAYGGKIIMKESGGTAHDILFVDSFGNINLRQAQTNQFIQFVSNAGVLCGYFDPANSYNQGQLYDPFGNRISGAAKFTGTGTGTYNHNYKNYTPAAVFITPNMNGSATIGADTIGSTTVHVTIGTANSFWGLAVHT